jgi:hypothetical protein
MFTQRWHQRGDTAASDKGHHYVDAIGRPYLCEYLMTHARLARRIRQKRRVQQWDQRFRNEIRPTVRQLTDYAA